jgi:molecular chaperone DnaK (HSP70)
MTINIPTAKLTTSFQHDDDSIWIGIDFGTTHCSVAVYDATRGGPKWMRLASAIPERRKQGRIVPTQLGVRKNVTKSEDTERFCDDLKEKCIIGYPAWKRLHEAGNNRHDNSSDYCFIPNLKRNFAQDPQGAYSDDYCTLKWIDAVALVLQRLRLEADDYIRLHASKKHLQTPGNGSCRNVVLGVPARYTSLQRHGMMEAAKRAGFTGHVSTVTESTAAAMAYGLFVGKRAVKTQDLAEERGGTRILVFDMGGGTTDITVALLHPPHRRDTRESTYRDDPSSRFQVETTRGDGQLGGDDMDEAILRYLVQRDQTEFTDEDPIQKRPFLRACQQAKEALTGNESTTIQWQGSSMSLTRAELDSCIAPLLHRARSVLDQALSSDAPIHEVVLIGGATRVPALRRMLRDAFPHIDELSTAVHPVSAVAQGCAIQAAWLSRKIPPHALESALMLDTTPYPLGVLQSMNADIVLRGSPQQIIAFDPNQHVFCELIPRDSPLPAMGSMLFDVAKAQQAGVTVLAVEYVPEEELFVVLNEFSFLLRRIKADQTTPVQRQVEVGMKLTEHGEVIVSVFDSNDPDHVRARGFDNAVEESITLEQWLLGMSCVILFALYVVVKLNFSSGGMDAIAEEL